MSEKLKYFPSYAGSSFVHSSLNTSICSDATAPRSLKGGAFKATNSSFIHPTPHPTLSLPSDNTSMDANTLAV